jgi:hydrogenase expression/formation protein HypC
LEINAPLAIPIPGAYVAPAGDGRSLREREAVSPICLAIPGQIMEIVDEQNRLAKVDVAGVHRNVNIGLLDVDGQGPGPGDWVLIHVGFALSQVDEEEALATRRMLERMGANYEQELEELKASVIE